MIDLLLIAGIITPDALGKDEYLNPYTYSVPVASLYEALKDSYSVKVLIPDVIKTDYLNHLPEARVYGISVSYPEMTELKKIVLYIRAKYPNSKIVLGGQYPTAFQADVFSYLEVDYVVLGNGIEAMRGILEGRLTKNVSTPSLKGDVVFDRTEVISSSILDNGAYVGIDWNEIEKNSLCDKESKWVVTSHGCLFNCGFCTNKCFSNQKILYRNMDRIINDINLYLEDNADSRIFLTEPLFSANNRLHRQYANELLNRVYNETPITVKNQLGIFCRMGDMNDEFIELLEKYSDKLYYNLLVGVDNFNDDILLDMKKHETKKGLLKSFEKIKNVQSINSLTGNIILGTPKDSNDIFNENVEDTYKLYRSYADSHINIKMSATTLWLLPGSQYYIDRNMYSNIYITDKNIDKQIQFVELDGNVEMNVGLQPEWFTKFQRHKYEYHKILRKIKGKE